MMQLSSIRHKRRFSDQAWPPVSEVRMTLGQASDLSGLAIPTASWTCVDVCGRVWTPPSVLPGLVPGIHVPPPTRPLRPTPRCRKTWMPGINPGTTRKWSGVRERYGQPEIRNRTQHYGHRVLPASACCGWTRQPEAGLSWHVVISHGHRRIKDATPPRTREYRERTTCRQARAGSEGAALRFAALRRM